MGNLLLKPCCCLIWHCLHDDEMVYDEFSDNLNFDTPTSVSKYLDDTVAKVVGKIRLNSDKRVIAPLSQRPCVYYSTHVFQMVTQTEIVNSNTTKTSLAWEPMLHESNGVDFIVEDNNGAKVSISGNSIYPHDQVEYNTKNVDYIQPVDVESNVYVKNLLAKHRKKPKWKLIGKRQVGVYECLYEEGGIVSVIGVLQGKHLPIRKMAPLQSDALLEKWPKEDNSWKAAKHYRNLNWVSNKVSGVILADKLALDLGSQGDFDLPTELIAPNPPNPESWNVTPALTQDRGEASTQNSQQQESNDIEMTAIAQVVPVPVQKWTEQTLLIKIPQGTKPGELITCQTPTGQILKAACPADTSTGAFTVKVRSPVSPISIQDTLTR